MQNTQEKIIKILNHYGIDNPDLQNLELKLHVKEHEEKLNNNLIHENNISMINIEEELKILNESKKLLETLKNYKLQEKKDFILNIINKALLDIFQSNIRIDIEPQEKKSNSNIQQKYDIVFYQNDIEMARNEELLKSNGGGIMQVISMLFKILIGYIYSENTFYIFDESFSQLSGSNRERLSKFLAEFCEKFKFTLIVVSHTPDLDEYAHNIYEVSSTPNEEGVNTLKLENSVVTESDEYFAVSISNFQSIKHVELKLHGFTIIRGPNNSGKSAILRAITSILYNNFDIKKYPRISFTSTGKIKQLPTEIILTKVNGNSYHTIGLKYKSKKVFFLIDGEEYYGKNLAGDRLKEEVEKLGFKYINTKEFYKNFKGNLKEQTERIASTNQYDSLFLVGGKSNETEKIFNFLFNTELISLGIVKCKEDISVLDKQFQELENYNLELVQKLSEIKEVINILQKVIHYMYINELNTLKEDVDLLNIQKETLFNKVNIINKIIPRLQHLIFLPKTIKDIINFQNTKNEILNSIQNKKLLLENLDKKLNVSETLLSKIKHYDFINKSLEYLNTQTENKNKDIDSLNTFKSRLNTINLLLEKLLNLNSLLNLTKHFSLITEINNLKHKLKDYQDKLSNLSEKYHLYLCPQCNGIGYISVKPGDNHESKYNR